MVLWYLIVLLLTAEGMPVADIPTAVYKSA